METMSLGMSKIMVLQRYIGGDQLYLGNVILLAQFKYARYDPI